MSRQCSKLIFRIIDVLSNEYQRDVSFKNQNEYTEMCVNESLNEMKTFCKKSSVNNA